jgi:1,4-dihydroxy-2-naphthoate octaprenyltransferase
MSLLIRTLRVPFFTAAVVPILVGTALAWYDGHFNGLYFVLTLLGAIAAHAAANVINDYYDHIYGNDEANQSPTPFSGGSRVIQEGLLPPKKVLFIALTAYAITIIIGLALTVLRGWPVLLIGVIGIAISFLYSYKVAYWGHGLGELLVSLGFGPVMVLGAYYVQTQGLSWGALWASIPVALLIGGVLYINEFPDYPADGAVKKNTLVVVLGRKAAVPGYVALVIGAYCFIVLGVMLSFLPQIALAALLTFPLAWRGIQGARRFYADTPKLIPTNAVTIQIHLFTGLLLTLGIILSTLLERFVLS